MPAVLLVDDEPDIVEALAQLVAQRFPDYDVRTAPNGMEALEMLDDVALVVSDFRMPGMNGLEFLTKVHDQFPEIPAVLLTAFNQRQSAVEAAQKGIIRRFFMKPPDVEALLDGLEELINPDNISA